MLYTFSFIYTLTLPDLSQNKLSKYPCSFLVLTDPDTISIHSKRILKSLLTNQVPWSDLVDTLARRLNLANGIFDTLKHVWIPNKVIDFKPLFPFLFPEFFYGYKYFGFGDTDMWYGNKLNSLSVPADYDMIMI